MGSSQEGCSVYLEGQLLTDHKLRKQMSEAQKVLILGFHQISLELLSEYGTSVSHICQFLLLNASNTILNMCLQCILALFSHR